VVVAAISVGTIWASRAHPIRNPSPIPAAKAIGPGIGIDVTTGDGSENIICTAGFLVRTKDDRPALLSAGHCNKTGGAGTVAIRHGGLFKYPVIGTFSETIYDGNDWNDFDIGLIALEPGKIPLTSEVDGQPVAGLADRVEIGDTLCHFGIRSGGAVCGPVAASEENKVRFTATARCGDSGGPVYKIRADGAIEAVGIFTAVSNGDYSEPTCDGDHAYSVAQLIKPWLTAWELSLVTTEP
ncbi:MAG: S1 family peptidase, partial [Actinomycetota bacterium]|nr:S1 family peptidase [Actinomycetota bacterium]